MTNFLKQPSIISRLRLTFTQYRRGYTVTLSSEMMSTVSHCMFGDSIGFYPIRFSVWTIIPQIVAHVTLLFQYHYPCIIH